MGDGSALPSSRRSKRGRTVLAHVDATVVLRNQIRPPRMRVDVDVARADRESRGLPCPRRAVLLFGRLVRNFELTGMTAAREVTQGGLFLLTQRGRGPETARPARMRYGNRWTVSSV
jgi:hypothetical protein